MTEEIGKVRLDYSKYPGKDFYSEGALEDELLDIVKSKSAAEYGAVIEERKKWSILYHLSPLRENIVDWVPMDKESRVLEVGSGCGAITGALSRKAGTVTCVELSKKRSLINAHRNRGCDNVTIHVGNFKDVEPDLPKDFDYICLIGVFEYGQSYIGGDTPYEDFLKLLLPHLAENGRILIAIENRYGLKYFAGCKEDHLGTYFSGIEHYGADCGVRTFGRNGLEEIFRKCGVGEYRFYYPYPDYKFMTMLYGDDYLPGKGELTNNLRNFDRDRMLLFDEKSAFDGLTEEGLFPLFSNSYMAVIGKTFDIKYVKYSNDRAPEYAVRTEIAQHDRGPVCVRKYPMTGAAREHVRGMAAACEKLEERYRGGRLKINPCRLEEEGDRVCAEFAFERGTALSELMDLCLEKDDLEGFYRYFQEYRERIGYNSEYPASDFDPIFSNILVDGEKWTLIDYEWTFGKPVDTKELAFRAVYCYLLEDDKRKKLDLERAMRELSVTEKEAETFREAEREFQDFVTGNRKAMATLREEIGGRVMLPQNWIDRYEDSDKINRVQIYEDRGEGCHEAESYFVRDAYQGENLIAFDIKVEAGVKRLRIDPAFASCSVKIQEMTLNGERVPLEKRKVLTANGRILSAAGKGENYCPSIVFPTSDPNFCIGLDRLKIEAENRLHVRMEIVRLPISMAQDMANGR